MSIRLDSETQLADVPPEAWTYKLGNRSALEWILDQYKEKTPKDPTIREKFNMYRFADRKGDRPDQARHARKRRDDEDRGGDACRKTLKSSQIYERTKHEQNSTAPEI